jgi:hypothetical protein
MTVLGASIKDRLDAMFALAAKQVADEEVLSHWARYLCVLTSGFIEVSLRSILSEYVAVRSHPDVTNFVVSRLQRMTNLNEEKVYKLLGAFQPAWAEQFRLKRTDTQKAALDSVVANRNQIAHGGSVGLTLARMKDYYGEIVAVLNLIEKECVRKNRVPTPACT